MFNIFAAVSVVLCLATVVLWVRSYFVQDHFYRWDDFRADGSWTDWVQDSVQIGKGGVGFNRIVQGDLGLSAQKRREGVLKTFARRGGIPPFHRNRPAAYPDFNFRANDEAVLGFKFGRFAVSRPGIRGWGIQVIVPLWALAVPLALPGGLWAWHRRRLRRQRRAGLCLNCGYDLRATPDRCPECGTPVPAGHKVEIGP